MGRVVWTPTQARSEQTLLADVARRQGFDPADYAGLWRWSVEDIGRFWQEAVTYSGVVWHRPPDAVLGSADMPGAEWFPGAELSFTRHLLGAADDRPAIVAADERGAYDVVTRRQLHERVSAVRNWLAARGVEPGDRVAALMPNRVETVVAMLAADSLGAIFSSCSPDFGVGGVVDRFGQISPKVLLVADGYHYNGATHRLAENVSAITARLEGLEQVLLAEVTGAALDLAGVPVTPWSAAVAEGAAAGGDATPLPRPFAAPLAVLYSSGTTGAPKSIVHSAGGTLVKHLCEQQLHSDIRPADVVFWFTTCGWMMWNWLVSALASDAAIVLYDGSPSHPDLGVLWRLAERAGVTHFGTSPKFLAACASAGVVPAREADLTEVRTVLSTGSPLRPEQFDWVYANVGRDLQLASISGGTDLIGCFAAGVPTIAVRRGELQGRVLGMAVEAWNDRGQSVVGEKGELVCTQPFPSMPIGFWNDHDGHRYREAYFSEHPGVWTHGDFIEITPSGGVVIHGRSDTTLNPGGVRIGTAELYRALDGLPEVADAVVVGRPVDGDVEVVLFVVPAEGHPVDETLRERIRARIRSETTPRHVPRHIVEVSAVPYTISGKKVEKAVLHTLLGRPVHNRDALADPAALDEYADVVLP